MARIPPPFTHTQQGADKYTETFTITHLSSTALLPQLWLSAVFWLDLSPLTYSISQGCCGQIGRLVVWLPPPSMLAEGSFIFSQKKKRHMHTRWHRHMCAQKHGCIQVLYGMIDMFDQHLLWSLWSALRSSVVCVLFTADIKFHEPWKEHQGIMSIIYQTLMTTLLEPSQITYHLNSTFNLIHLTSQNVNTPTDCCMLCLVHREISGLCMVVRDLHLNNHFCILYHSCDLLGGSIWCIFWYNLKI